jgi:hypothetical protein
VAITYGGYTFLALDEGFELGDFLARNAELERLNLFAWAGPTPRPAQVYLPPRWPRHVLPTIQAPAWPDPPKLEINQLYVPTGASRWSVGLFLCDGTTANKLPEVGELTLGDGSGTPITYRMFVLAVIPIGRSQKQQTAAAAANPLQSQAANAGTPAAYRANANAYQADQAHLVVLVDERYYRQHQIDTATVSTETTWEELCQTLDPLSCEFPEGVFGAVDNTQTGFRPSGEFDSRPDSEALLFDAACACAGLRIVPKFNVKSTTATNPLQSQASNASTPAAYRQQAARYYEAQTPIGALALLNANTKAWSHIHGGRHNTPVPSAVHVEFPAFLNEWGANDQMHYRVKVEFGQAGAINTGTKVSTAQLAPWTIRCGAFADAQDLKCDANRPAFDGRTAARVRNNTRLQAIAKLLAKAYYSWQCGGYTFTFPGIAAWKLTGYDDCVIYHCGSQRRAAGEEHNPGGYRMLTVVRGLPSQFGITDVPAWIQRQGSYQNGGQSQDYDAGAEWLTEYEYYASAAEDIASSSNGVMRVNDNTYAPVRVAFMPSSQLPPLRMGERALIRYFPDLGEWRVVSSVAQVHLFETIGPFVWESDDKPIHCPAKQLTYIQPHGDTDDEGKTTYPPGDYQAYGDTVEIYWSQCPRDSDGKYLHAVAGAAGLRFACVWQTGNTEFVSSDPNVLARMGGKWEIIDGWDLCLLARLSSGWDYSGGAPSASARLMYWNGSSYTASDEVTIYNPAAPQDNGEYTGNPKGAAGQIYTVMRTHDNLYVVTGGASGTELVVFKLSSGWSGSLRPRSATAIVQEYSAGQYRASDQTITVYWGGGAFDGSGNAYGLPVGSGGSAWGAARFNADGGYWEVVAMFDPQAVYVGTMQSDWECSGSSGGTSGAVTVNSGGQSFDVSAFGYGFAQGAKLRQGAQVIVSFLPDDSSFVFIGIPREGDAGGDEDSEDSQTAKHMGLFRTDGGWTWSGTTTAPYCQAKRVTSDPDEQQTVQLYWVQAPRKADGTYVQCAAGAAGHLFWATDISENQWKIIDGLSWSGLVKLSGEWTYHANVGTATAKIFYGGSESTAQIEVTLNWSPDGSGLPFGGTGDIYACSQTAQGVYEVKPRTLFAAFRLTGSWQFPSGQANDGDASCVAQCDFYHYDNAGGGVFAKTGSGVVGWRGTIPKDDGSFAKLPTGSSTNQWGMAMYDFSAQAWVATALWNEQMTFRATLKAQWNKVAGDDAGVDVTVLDASVDVKAFGAGFPTGATLANGTEVVIWYATDEDKFYFNCPFGGIYKATLKTQLSRGGNVQADLAGTSPTVTVTVYDALLKTSETLATNSTVLIGYSQAERKFYVLAASCP